MMELSFFMKRQRLDQILIKEGIAESREKAFILVTEGKVFVDGQKAVSPAQIIGDEAKIEFRGGREYVGRGALKLEAAIKNFGVDVEGKICADIGAATGGFTEILLKYGARKVYAIDTAKGKLDQKIRRDPRVVVMEEIDVRDLEELSDPIEIAVIDISLIPLEQILPSVRRFLSERGSVIALFKPQYETRDTKILIHGIVEDKERREELFENFLEWVEEQGWKIIGTMESPIRGGEGNVEYLIHMRSKN